MFTSLACQAVHQVLLADQSAVAKVLHLARPLFSSLVFTTRLYLCDRRLHIPPTPLHHTYITVDGPVRRESVHDDIQRKVTPRMRFVSRWCVDCVVVHFENDTMDLS
jgi:hypothetical protein